MDQNTAQLIEKFRRNPAMAQSLLQSGDGQKLMQMLTRQDGGAALNRAAQSAAMGNTKELAAMLSSLMQSPEGMAVMNRINGSLIYSAPSVSQRAALQALAMRKEIREKYVTAYRDRIFYAADRIEKLPYLSLVRPKGTFYLFPGVEKTGLDEKAFCKVLLDQAHVLVSPGTPFGVSAAGHFRIACTVGIDRLKAAFDRMEKLSF